MDDARIAELTAEVLADLRTPAASARSASPADLESRVAALEARIRALPTGPVAVAVAAAGPGPSHPSLQLLGPAGGSERCLLEPDKPCVGSGQCRTFGH